MSIHREMKTHPGNYHLSVEEGEPSLSCKGNAVNDTVLEKSALHTKKSELCEDMSHRHKLPANPFLPTKLSAIG